MREKRDIKWDAKEMGFDSLGVAAAVVVPYKMGCCDPYLFPPEGVFFSLWFT